MKQETNLGTALAAFCNYVCHKVSIILALETYFFFWRTVDRGKGRAHGKKWRVINETPRLILVEESFPSFCRRKKRKKKSRFRRENTGKNGGVRCAFCLATNHRQGKNPFDCLTVAVVRRTRALFPGSYEKSGRRERAREKKEKIIKNVALCHLNAICYFRMDGEKGDSSILSLFWHTEKCFSSGRGKRCASDLWLMGSSLLGEEGRRY